MWAVSRHILNFASGRRLFRPILEHPVTRLQSDVIRPFSLQVELIAGVLLMAYSAFFFMSWNSEFPTPTEQLLWRISSTVMISLPGIYGWVNFLVEFTIIRNSRTSTPWTAKLEDLARSMRRSLNPARWTFKRKFKRHNGNHLDQVKFDRDTKLLMVAMIIGQIHCIAYGVARAYVLIEDFVGLRRMPASTFTTITWTRYLPRS